ncbi:hypothetical protein P7K49_037067 [Saguinus oedipus]|uniref:Uncharacterized protein n=1 Tax=Saguinus oedipus TaxID=9490 RepID=A0ABQ9TLW7_SAGOE|nr:hypothetical protein P7K49_037067 [Saguinus oedipus]
MGVDPLLHTVLAFVGTGHLLCTPCAGTVCRREEEQRCSAPPAAWPARWSLQDQPQSSLAGPTPEGPLPPRARCRADYTAALRIPAGPAPAQAPPPRRTRPRRNAWSLRAWPACHQPMDARAWPQPIGRQHGLSAGLARAQTQ